MSRIFLSSPHMGGNEVNYINDAFEKNWIAPLGENVTEFEKVVKEYNKVGYSVALSSGTAAIHLALIECGVGKGDIVFASSLTFSATTNPIFYQGATPVLIDSEPDSWNMSPVALKEAFEAYKDNLPKAVIAVNLYGQPAKLDEIKAICDKYNVLLIEDAAESLGATYKGRMTGSVGDLGIYSFNGNKIITTSGGGMLVSNNENFINHALFLSTQARDNALHYQHSELGYNYRLSNISAGIGRGQMEVLNERIDKKRKIFKMYYDNLNDLPGIEFQNELKDTYSNRWLTALTIDERVAGFNTNDVINLLNKYNIESRPVWKPMHLQPLYDGYKYFKHNHDQDVSKELFKSGICLPSDSKMTVNEQRKVINIIKSLYE